MSTALPVLRRSAMQSAASCLHRFNELWNKGTPDHNDYSLRGIGFHACAHRYIERLIQAQTPMDAEEAKHAFREGIASALIPAHLVPEIRELFFKWAERFGLELGAFLAAEEHQIGKDQQTFTPDLVYGRTSGLEIVDFKTYFVQYTESQLRADWQTRFYLYAAMQIWPNFPKYTFTHSYVRFGTSVSVDFGPNDFGAFADEVEAIIATVAEATERNEWPATAGPECAFCQLQCPLADHPAVVPKRFTLPEQAQTVGSWILAAETMLRAAKKALKSYCAANGAVEIKGGVEFDNRPVLQRSYQVGAVLKVLNQRGILGAFDDPSLTISHSALAKLFKAYPMLQDDLLPFQQSKTSFRFSARKPEEGEDFDE